MNNKKKDSEIDFEEGDYFSVKDFEGLKEKIKEIWVEPEYDISNWKEKGGLKYIKISDIKEDGDEIYSKGDLVVKEYYSNGDSKQVLYYDSDINLFIKQGYISKTEQGHLD